MYLDAGGPHILGRESNFIQCDVACNSTVLALAQTKCLEICVSPTSSIFYLIRIWTN